jgi:hypothetical protein
VTKYVPEPKAENPLPLDQQISRIAQSLANSRFANVKAGEPSSSSPRNEFRIQPDAVREIIRARHARAVYFPGELFSDSAWDILLGLLLAKTSHRQATVSSLFETSGLSVAVISRWVSALADKGLVVLGPETDAVELTPEATSAFHDYFYDIFRRD